MDEPANESPRCFRQCVDHEYDRHQHNDHPYHCGSGVGCQEVLKPRDPLVEPFWHFLALGLPVNELQYTLVGDVQQAENACDHVQAPQNQQSPHHFSYHPFEELWCYSSFLEMCLFSYKNDTDYTRNRLESQVLWVLAPSRERR